MVLPYSLVFLERKRVENHCLERRIVKSRVPVKQERALLMRQLAQDTIDILNTTKIPQPGNLLQQLDAFILTLRQHHRRRRLSDLNCFYSLTTRKEKCVQHIYISVRHKKK